MQNQFHVILSEFILSRLYPLPSVKYSPTLHLVVPLVILRQDHILTDDVIGNKPTQSGEKVAK